MKSESGERERFINPKRRRLTNQEISETLKEEYPEQAIKAQRLRYYVTYIEKRRSQYYKES